MNLIDSIILFMWFVISGIVIANQYRMLTAYKRYFKSNTEYVDEMQKYCLNHILQEAAKREDFEQCKRVKAILDKIETPKL